MNRSPNTTTDTKTTVTTLIEQKIRLSIRNPKAPILTKHKRKNLEDPTPWKY